MIGESDPPQVSFSSTVSRGFEGAMSMQTYHLYDAQDGADDQDE